MLTRKHFEWLAARVASAILADDQHGGALDHSYSRGMRQLAIELGHHFGPHFDQARFEKRIDQYVSGERDPYEKLTP